MTDEYAEDIAVVTEAMDAVYENKQVNKKDNISGDFSSDTASYPTVKAVKGALEGKLDKTHTSYKGKNVVTDANGEITFENKPTIPDVSGKIDTAGTGLSKSGTTLNHSNSVTALTTASLKKVKYDAQGHITGTSDVSASDLPSHTHSQYEISFEKQATPESGYASTYVIKQNGVQVGPKINIEKDKMMRSASVETVGSTPTSEETSYNMTTGDQYILMVVNTVDNDGTSRLIIPITDAFDLQTADETTITLSAGGVFSIKSGGVDTAQLKNGAVTSDKIATSVKNTWLSTADVRSEISAFAQALAEAINPSS